MRTHRRIAPALFLLATACASATTTPGPTPSATAAPPVIPVPAEVQNLDRDLLFTGPVRVSLGSEDTRLRTAVGAWIDEESDRFGIPFVLSDAADAEVRVTAGGSANSERYALETTASSVRIAGESPAGAFYGLQTLRQIMTAEGGGVRVPGVRIADEPRFGYRGLHLDVGRHFFGTDEVKRYIDTMARFKFNTFHWHLTEDQGWRIQIDAYPRLTEIGGCRSETIVEKNFDPFIGDGTEYCGFYTKDEIREVVEYAAERFVTIIPEIEMPGHSLAALAAYPQFACTDGPFEVGTRWGVYEEIYCPWEETFAFLETVLDEVIELFPSRLIHIGGDEAPKTRWEESALAQQVMEREGLADEFELQSWFIRRIERFLISRGRNLIGWDEILEGGLAPEATVMSWRGTAGGIEAAEQGHDVVMTPTSHLYFDFYQGDPRTEPLAIGGFTTLSRVYEFEPIPPELDATEARHILGAQANLWTEYIPTWDHLEYMAYPRALALAEVVWSPWERRDWPGFLDRLPNALEQLDRLGVAYRPPDVEGLDGDVLTMADAERIELTIPLPSAEIRYTLDGSDPGPDDRLYTGPFEVDVSGGPVTISARGILPTGRTTALRRATVTRARLTTPVVEGGLERGLDLHYYQGAFVSLGQMFDADPLVTTVAAAPALSEVEPQDGFGLDFRGYLRVPEDGLYAFRLGSDDGSRLWVADRVVIDHDGLHGTTFRTGQIALAAGAHALRVAYFQSGGGKSLSLEVRGPGDDDFRPVPADWFLRRR